MVGSNPTLPTRFWSISMEDDIKNEGFGASSYEEEEEFDYKANQQKWRDAGWNAYNSDYVDEFPTW